MFVSVTLEVADIKSKKEKYAEDPVPLRADIWSALLLKDIYQTYCQ